MSKPLITLTTIANELDAGLAALDVRIKAERLRIRDTDAWYSAFNEEFYHGGDDTQKTRATNKVDDQFNVPRSMNDQRNNYERILLNELLGRHAQQFTTALYDPTAERWLLLRLNAEIDELPKIDAGKIRLI